MADADRATSPLAPGFLVASPALADPNCAGSLVLMARHGSEGALGFVANRAAPLAPEDVLAAVDPSLPARCAGRAGAPVLAGGPVEPGRLWILFRAGAFRGDGVVEVGSNLSVGGTRELLATLASDPEAGGFRLVLGCAGWGPMQLEREVARGAWIPLPLQEDLLELPIESRWGEAVRRLGLDPAGFAMGGGGAKA